MQNLKQTVDIEISNEQPRYDNLEQWLTMQQLQYLVPVLKKIGWHKLKEAALIAKQLADMQGTEHALKLLLRLLEVDDNFKLYRYWKRQTESGQDMAFDNLHATDLADAGYELTYKLKATYQEDNINPWSSDIYSVVHKLVVSLDDIIACIRHSLPATLEITDYELIKVGLGVIAMQFTNYRSHLQESNVVVDARVQVPDILQYTDEPFIYDLQTKELIRIAEASEVHAKSLHMTVLTVSANDDIYNFCCHIGDEHIELQHLRGTKHFCISPAVGEHTMTWSYMTELGNRFSMSKQVKVYNASSRQFIYELCPASIDDSAAILDYYNVAAIMMQWQHTTDTCDGRPMNIFAPKPYQLFYVPYDARRIQINDGTVLHNYEFDVRTYGRLPQIDDFVVSIEYVKLANSNEAAQRYLVLSPIKPCGKYDYTVKYMQNVPGNVPVHAAIWHDAMQLTKYITIATEPFWNAHVLRQLIDDANADKTVKISINGVAANNGGYIVCKDANGDIVLDKAFGDRLLSIGQTACNYDNNGSIASLSIIADDATIAVEARRTAICKAIRRQPSFGIKPVTDIKMSMPYIAVKADTWFDLYSNDVLIKQGYGMLVFAKHTNNKYRLHVHNDWYDKTIEL